MRTSLVVLALVGAVSLSAQPKAGDTIGTRPDHPVPSHCCVDKVYDAKGKLVGDLMIYDTYHHVSWAAVRYTLKGGDTVALLVSPWTILTDL
jgi:hypothetical protein